MDLSPLDKWLKVSTWNTLHPSDEKRFNQAVLNLMRVNGATGIHPDDFKNYIMEMFQGRLEHDYLVRVVERYTDKYDAISSFYYDNDLLQ
ncbi:hypothetical protein CJP72_05255 [Citrobacter sp. NCU1]|uniref:hypothetical protein n=1 Tax=Citrobacter sp. NCU1 TaxID=2026683 RepID=UPI0013911800|nr:hypothetical protein [Citrobacter sp. NCU1]NDO80204.1 hypothetical protein [Citrobacter sp. NCU1]